VLSVLAQQEHGERRTAMVAPDETAQVPHLRAEAVVSPQEDGRDAGDAAARIERDEAHLGKPIASVLVRRQRALALPELEHRPIVDLWRLREPDEPVPAGVGSHITAPSK
jgi:hypothetical protein